MVIQKKGGGKTGCVGIKIRIGYMIKRIKRIEVVWAASHHSPRNHMYVMNKAKFVDMETKIRS